MTVTRSNLGELARLLVESAHFRTSEAKDRASELVDQLDPAEEDSSDASADESSPDK